MQILRPGGHKMLAQLAVVDPASFSSVVGAAQT